MYEISKENTGVVQKKMRWRKSVVGVINRLQCYRNQKKKMER